MEHAPGDDRLQMEAVDTHVVEVQTWMYVMPVEAGQMELEDCRSSFVEEREWDPQNLQQVSLVGRGAMATRWVPSKREMGGCCERRCFDEEQTGGQGFQRVGWTQGNFVRSNAAVGSGEAVLSMVATYSSDGRVKKVMIVCQKSTLESALQGRRLHRFVHESGSRAGSVQQAEFLAVRFPQGGVGVFFLPKSWSRLMFGEDSGAR